MAPCSCLENPMDKGAWWAAVHGVTGSRTQLSNFTFTFHFHALEKEVATHSSIFCQENPVNSMKRQTDTTLKEELPRSVSAQYATGDQWRNNTRKNEGMEPKQKKKKKTKQQHPVMDMMGDGSKVQCCKE